MRRSRLVVRAIRLTPTFRADALLVPVVVKDDKIKLPAAVGLDPRTRRQLEELAGRTRSLGSTGAIESQSLPPGAPFGRIALVSLGDQQTSKTESIASAAGAALAWCNRQKIRRAAVSADALRATGEESAAAAWVEGFALAGFRYTRLRTNASESEDVCLDRLTLCARGPGLPGLARAAARAQEIADAANLARELGHEPPNLLNPVTLASRCRSLANRFKLGCRVFEERRLKALRMGAFLAVGGGSASKPRMIVLEHAGGRPKSRPIVLVGKAITLDTGGYSIKPANTIPDMKYDKCGGMAVLGALVAASRLKIPRRIVGIIGAAENMISDRAYRPGDIVRAASGKTIEVVNTDAEGRLVLADCLHFAERAYKPSAIIDLATLTGACVVALGTPCAGLMSNDDALAAALIESGERTGERLWRLPLWPVYREQIAGTDGDIKNSGGRNGGAITAGMFLKEFVGDSTPWAHLDIAGPATTDKATPICPVGATGFGVRLLVDYLLSRK